METLSWGFVVLLSVGWLGICYVVGKGYENGKDNKDDVISPREISVSKQEILGARDFRYKHCRAAVGIGKDEEEGKWATVYLIETEPAFRGQGEATALLERLKYDFERRGYKFALWCPMSAPIAHICEELRVTVV